MAGARPWGHIVAGLFVVLAVGTLIGHRVGDRTPVTGDEPHYLVMADSLIEDRSLELTEAYRREFRDRSIYSAGLAGPDEEPTADNTHAVEGPRGLYSVHSFGVPAVVALPFAVGGVVTAKLAMIAVGAVGVAVTWRMSRYHVGSPWERAVAVGAVATGMTLVNASTQLYPDLSTGVIALVGLAMVQRLERSDVDVDPRRHLLVACVVASLPWFHIKTAATAVLLSVVLAALVWRRTRSRRRAATYIVPLVASGVLLMAYNAWAFGQVTGPYSEGALRVGGMPITVLLGLYVDQFHGMFVQTPALLAALVALIPFLRRFPITGTVLLVTHASLIVPNAMHWNWYGGFSFAGRFGVAGLVVLMPVAVFGMSWLLANRTTVVPVVLVALCFVYNGVQFIRYGVLGGDLYNDRLVLPAFYPSQVPFARDVLPMLYQADWSLRFAPNLAAVVACLLLVAVGGLRSGFGSLSAPTLRRTVGGLAGLLLVGGAVLASEPAAAVRFPGAVLPTINAIVDGEVARADANGGIVTFGPYVRVGEGAHSFRVRYRADGGTDGTVVGEWVLKAGPDTPLVGGELIGTSAERVDGVQFDVSRELAGSYFEVVTTSRPGVDLEVIEVSVERVTGT